ncbi:MAG: response regulator [Coleofasciculaceae cyanobacterium]
MSGRKKQITILLAEDSPEDQQLIKQAFQESVWRWRLYIVSDGEKLLDYLYHRGQYQHKKIAPRPDLILLDLYLPKIDGSEALKTIKADLRLQRLPVVILTSSKAEADIHRSYQLGASSYLTKPLTFALLVDAVNILGEYWFDVVELPPASTYE